MAARVRGRCLGSKITVVWTSESWEVWGWPLPVQPWLASQTSTGSQQSRVPGVLGHQATTLFAKVLFWVTCPTSSLFRLRTEKETHKERKKVIEKERHRERERMGERERMRRERERERKGKGKKRKVIDWNILGDYCMGYTQNWIFHISDLTSSWAVCH